ncbi:MAG: DUF2142 domain-containing protein [Oliverpabstia sp.]
MRIYNEWLNSKGKKRNIQIVFFLISVFVFLTAWAVVQPLDSSPDEKMRYQIVQFLVKHGTLPDGRDPEIRNEFWGISYAFNPILAYMIMAIPAKIVSMFTSSAMAMLIASRMVNVVFGTCMAYLVMRIGEMLFDGREKWLFTCLITFLPGLVFVHSYVNNDSMALLSSAWIVYAWVRSIREGWTVKVSIHLALAISMAGLSYYNVYGFILCSMLFFAFSVLFASGEKKDVAFLFARGGMIAVIVILLIGWWFIRNGILYDGDILGWNISTEYAEKYAIEELKPSNRATPEALGWTIKDMMLYQPSGWEHNWLVTVAVSFVGTFGYLNIFMPTILSKVYLLFLAVGLFGMLPVFKKMFSMRGKKVTVRKEKTKTETIKCKTVVKQNIWNWKNLFHWHMLLAMVIPVILLVKYSYQNDFQAQGRYILPMVIPFMYFVTCGYGTVTERLVKNERIKKWLYTGIETLYVLGAVYTYFGVFLPNYL